ncbi:MAG: glutamate-1-semialdehyde 2,1-aminomutase [Bacteroidales bacterium]|nr:glutamate-1-semialdehyde 2,1-aminomutase [Bacteroidales bacterium]
MNQEKSREAFNRAAKVIPGGVNSPVRAFKSVGINPVVIDYAKGTTITDIDGNQYIDFVSSWGPLILGHANESILEAIRETAVKGTSFGAPTILETEMAELIVQMVPSVDKVRMVNSGTEATMSVLRLARGYTKKDLVIKFTGNYHGHADSFLIKAGSGAITLGLPDSPGVTKATAKDTLLADYNELDSVELLLKKHQGEVAAIIVEPVAGNMGVVPPEKGFLEGLRKLADNYGALLIFDEVITGFRLAKGGAQEYYGVHPDLTTLGKIIGGGLPVGAYGGKAEIMDLLAPDGPVYQAGTLSGNPLAMAAGLAMLKALNETPGFYEALESKAARLENGLRENLEKTATPGVVNRVGSLLTLFFTQKEQVTSYDEAMASDTEKFANYFRHSLENGIYLAPSQFEAMFVSYAHTDEDIDKCIAASLEAMQKI